MGIGLCCRSDIATLSIEYNDQACPPSVCTDLLQRGETIRTQRLEERHLRLDSGNNARHGVNDPKTERAGGGCSLRSRRRPPTWQSIQVRVEADTSGRPDGADSFG